MKRRKSKAFTLIELIGVLVIMSIIALIVTPLVMSIIRKARISADKRSVDAYGRSIELAIAGYLLDTGKFPTEVSQLTIEYSGNKVECETTQLNSDSSVYLTGCTVAGRSTGNYKYGSNKSQTYKAYEVGDEVTYNNIDYYVIKGSNENETTVILLKAEPLSVEEVNLYGGVGTENNHVNRYTESSVGTARDSSGYGSMAYYSSETCGDINSSRILDGCINDYDKSDIKYVVDEWVSDKVPSGLIYSRLITLDDFNNLGYEQQQYCSGGNCSMKFSKTENTPTWVYSTGYWLSSPYDDSSSSNMAINDSGGLYGISVNHSLPVRPVIVLDKSVL